MLVLTRKPQETIRIGDNITITVIKTKGNSVRLGIEAPTDVSVLRGELVATATDFDESPILEQKPARDPAGKHGPRDTTPSDSGSAAVRHTRAPKGASTQSRVQSILPQVLGEPGPLRKMMANKK